MIQFSRWLLAHCRTTGEQVVAAVGPTYTVVYDQIMWWRCPACKGWHAMCQKKPDPIHA